jgi:ABC-type glycerol-3-phosphate transport system permease component
MGILTVVFAWNSFLWPLIVLSDPGKYVLSIAIASLQGQYSARNNLLTTASVLGTLPVLAVFIVGQKYFLEGISTSGMKL